MKMDNWLERMDLTDEQKKIIQSNIEYERNWKEEYRRQIRALEDRTVDLNQQIKELQAENMK